MVCNKEICFIFIKVRGIEKELYFRLEIRNNLCFIGRSIFIRVIDFFF